MTGFEANETITKLREHGEGLTEWETNFLQSLWTQLETYHRAPSEKQAAILQKISQERLPNGDSDT